MALHGLGTAPFWLALAGVVVAWFFYLVKPGIPAAIGRALRPLVVILENKYYLDWFNENVLARLARGLGFGLWKGGDGGVIDGVLVNGSARLVGGVARLTRHLQSGHLYWYALVMILGVFVFMTWQLWPGLPGLAGR
jgi:NADH-quinone oxidoreductase subunit L